MPDVRIVIDVFRASTTAIALLDASVEELLVANELDILKRYSALGYLVVSEVFDLGIDNSPTLVKKTCSASSKVILKTTNLTAAIASNSFDGTLLVAGFVNLAATVKYIRQHDFERVEILPAGRMSAQQPTMEDSACAALFASHLNGVTIEGNYRTDLERLIETKRQQENKASHYLDDIVHAIQEDLSSIVAIVKLVGEGFWKIEKSLDDD